MREIKFRAWDKHNGVMIAPHDGDFIKWHAMSNWRDCLHVMQYTGLKDVNGVEIYEGDIIESDVLLPSEVLFKNYEACFAFGDWSVCEYFAYYVGESPDGDTRYSVKVIGNIHDNPELLEEV